MALDAPDQDVPITLRIPVERLATSLLISCFTGLVLLCLGAVGSLALCLAGLLIVGGGIGCFFYQRRLEILIQADRMVVRTAFSQKSYPYAGMNLLLRRSWTRTMWRGAGSGTGLAGVAIQLRRGNRVVYSIPVSWRSSHGFEEAMAFFDGLPLPKKYL